MNRPIEAIALPPNTFRKYGCDFRLVVRIGNDWRIYERTTKFGTQQHEVMRMRIVKEGTLPDGSIMPRHMRLPGTTEWGTHGWTVGGGFEKALDFLKRKVRASLAKTAH